MSLQSKKKDELIALCKERQLSSSGPKAVLIARLLGEEPPVPTTRTTRRTTTPIVRSPPPDPACFATLEKRYIHARKNAHGNFEDPETHLIFDATTRAVIGKQTGAEVLDLSIEDVRYCREHKIAFAPTRFDGHFVSSSTEPIETTLERLLKEKAAEEDDDAAD